MIEINWRFASCDLNDRQRGFIRGMWAMWPLCFGRGTFIECLWRFWIAVHVHGIGSGLIGRGFLGPTGIALNWKWFIDATQCSGEFNAHTGKRELFCKIPFAVNINLYESALGLRFSLVLVMHLLIDTNTERVFWLIDILVSGCVSQCFLFSFCWHPCQTDVSKNCYSFVFCFMQWINLNSPMAANLPIFPGDSVLSEAKTLLAFSPSG